jgi:hypothetical protein
VIAHVVLFRPRRDLSPADRQALVATFGAALQAIPSIRRARVGRRVTHGRPGYEQLMRADFPYAAIIEFDDNAGLAAYLEHPAHDQLGTQFFAVFEEALMYDFDLADGAAGLTKLL